MQINKHPNSVQFVTNSGNSIAYFSDELVDYLGGVDAVTKLIGDRQFENRLAPYKSSINRPYSINAWKMLQRNAELGQRHWVFRSRCIVGSTNHWGYGYQAEHGFQFWDIKTNSAHGTPINGRTSW